MYSYTRFETIGDKPYRLTTVYHYCDERGERQYTVPREEVEAIEPSLKAIEEQHTAEVYAKMQRADVSPADKVVHTPVHNLLGWYDIATAWYVEYKRY